MSNKIRIEMPIAATRSTLADNTTENPFFAKITEATNHKSVELSIVDDETAELTGITSTALFPVDEMLTIVKSTAAFGGVIEVYGYPAVFKVKDTALTSPVPASHTVTQIEVHPGAPAIPGRDPLVDKDGNLVSPGVEPVPAIEAEYELPTFADLTPLLKHDGYTYISSGNGKDLAKGTTLLDVSAIPEITVISDLDYRKVVATIPVQDPE